MSPSDKLLRRLRETRPALSSFAFPAITVDHVSAQLLIAIQGAGEFSEEFPSNLVQTIPEIWSKRFLKKLFSSHLFLSVPEYRDRLDPKARAKIKKARFSAANSEAGRRPLTDSKGGIS